MSQSQPNIVLVTMDSLRGDHCGHLGSRRALTPAMDALAEEGVSYQQAIAPGPQTFSSMPATFTGQHRPNEPLTEYPGETHWERRLAAIDAHLGRFTSFPSRLQKLGYTTAGVSPNPWTSRSSGFDRGFDHFVDLSGKDTDSGLTSILDRLPGLPSEDRGLELVTEMLTGSAFFAKWTDIYSEVTRLQEVLPEPYFLWVFLLDTHYPFLTDRRYREEQSMFEMYYSAYRSEGLMRGREDSETEMDPALESSVRRGYRDTIRAADAFVDRLHTDSDDEPVLMVHSDHGESFGDHGNYGHHHRTVYEENVHVPFFVHNASHSATVTDPVSLTQLPEAVVDIACDRFDPTAYTSEHAIASSECGTHRTVRGKRFKYIESDGERTLYDLETDPGERTDCSESYPDRFRELGEKLDRVEATRSEFSSVAGAANQLALSGRF